MSTDSASILIKIAKLLHIYIYRCSNRHESQGKNEGLTYYGSNKRDYVVVINKQLRK